jgi:mono/diheme cytochrome c family protein
MIMDAARRSSSQFTRWIPALLVVAVAAAAVAAVSRPGDAVARSPLAAAFDEQVLNGRRLVIGHGCGDCHGGWPNPAAEGYLAGHSEADQVEMVGPFHTWPANITPDVETGIGRYSERQIFNALRFGLRPSATPDVEITSHVPGQGNHPAQPNYLAPSMPWVYWRYMSDEELRDIAAYLKRGLRPVRHVVPASESPPDHWAEQFAPEGIGSHVLPPFPTAQEELRDAARREQVLRGRTLVAHMACGACHGGVVHPGQEGWMIGAHPDNPFSEFPIGEFKTRSRNLTPDNATGMGRFTERQIFNALRYGLRPGETPDVDITSTAPGQGNHPLRPKYLAPPMPWPAWRHMSDQELRDIAAYLKNGVRPVNNRVEDSEGPPDFWASEYTVEKYGPWPAAPFPTARERAPLR